MNAQTQAVPGAMAVSAVKSAGNRPPWYCYAIVLGALCVPIGALWDISWHLTVGRDSFWTAAHVLIYLGGAVPGTICGWLVLKNTFRPVPEEAAATVRLWGFRGPMGAWVVIWGAFAMLVSAPFDNWWHNAYGLDVEIISPPHTVLATGMFFVAVGAMLLVLPWCNRAGKRSKVTTLLFLIACGTLLTKMAVFSTEYTYPNHQHAAFFYQVAASAFPFWLVAAARASGLRWGATGTAAIYTAILLALIWILPLFRAQPMLAPIYNPVTHMVPPPFPLLLIVPALGIDLCLRFLGRNRGFWRDTGLALLLGLIFVALLIAVQWPFSEFLLSPASRNPFFAGNAMWGYNAGIGDWCTRFWDVDENPVTPRAIIVAVLLGGVLSRLALWLGNWLASVKR